MSSRNRCAGFPIWAGTTMPGETDLHRLLAGLDPQLQHDPYGFAVLPHGQVLPPGLAPFGLLREVEGLTVIATRAELDAAGLAVDGQWAMITMMVQSALSAVGMSAAMASALAAAGISANIVAAYHHDHVFVPWDRRTQALAVLQALAPAAPDKARPA